MGTHFKGSAREVRALDAYIKLMRCAASVALALDRRLAAEGLTESQLGVLETILHLGPRAQKDLARKRFFSDGNMTVVVDDLERRGLVTRTRDTADRRRVIVDLTPEGRALIERVFPGHVEAIAGALAPLGAAEQEALGALCKKVGLASAASAAG